MTLTLGNLIFLLYVNYNFRCSGFSCYYIYSRTRLSSKKVPSSKKAWTQTDMLVVYLFVVVSSIYVFVPYFFL